MTTPMAISANLLYFGLLAIRNALHKKGKKILKKQHLAIYFVFKSIDRPMCYFKKHKYGIANRSIKRANKKQCSFNFK